MSLSLAKFFSLIHSRDSDDVIIFKLISIKDFLINSFLKSSHSEIFLEYRSL